MTCRPLPSLLAGLLTALLVAPAVGAAEAPDEEPAGAPPGPLLVVNEGRPGPLRGRVPIRLDARTHQPEFAFVVLRIADREGFVSNAPLTVQQWDTRQYPDGRYRLVAEAHAKAWLLARSPAVEIEIRNSGGGLAGADGRGLAPHGSRKLPSPSWKSITVASPHKAVVLPKGMRLGGGRASVPVRRVVEAAGGKVGWEPSLRRVTATCGGHQASMTIGRTDARRDGEPVRLDAAPHLRAGRTQVHARALGDLLDLFVGWVHEAKCVQFTSNR